MSLVTVLAPERAPWIDQIRQDWAWLTTPDLRILWAILAATAVLAAWGAYVGFRRS